MYGIDIYDRYQDIVNPTDLKASPFDWAYVKGTDGGGRAAAPADALVRIIEGLDLPVGLYHYAQLSPSPEAQAEILDREIRRLDVFGLPPALDLEDPFHPDGKARLFAQRFLARLVQLGHPFVVLYGNTTMLNGIKAWELDDALKPIGGSVRIWAASYGGNDADYDDEDRQRLARAYPHPVWIHQYSSTGSVPGIPGNVDKNWMFGNLNGDDMATPRENWEDYRVQVLARDGSAIVDSNGTRYQISPQEMLAQNNRVGWANAADLASLLTLVGTVNGQLAGLTEAVKQLAAGQGVSLDEIEDAAERGAKRGVESATVDVDVNITGRTQFDTPSSDTPTV